MTGYTITVGYNSSRDKKEVEQEIISCVQTLQRTPKLILDEIARVEPQKYPEELTEYADSYRDPIEDLTLRISIKEEDFCMVQFASGTGTCRDYKEICRRAVCRLVMNHCHSKGMEININVG